MAAISNIEGGRFIAFLFVSGWISAIMGGLSYINQTYSLLFAGLFWSTAVIILIWNRVKNYQVNRLSMQSDWNGFEDDSETEFTSLPNPSEFELDIPL
ncbi:MAG: hypothetical protein VXX50_02510 [Candidatus Thermoplasmatota archaeon]|nr:hypothetical protein [Candidatus Thermoplasmatota archaeon]